MKPKVFVREQSWLARKAARKLGYNQVAMVIGHTIHLHNTTLEKFFGRPSWVFHELKHVEQYERLGTLPFLIKYLTEYLRRGYRNNAFEAEARAAEADPQILDRFDLSAYAQYMQKGYEFVRQDR